MAEAVPETSVPAESSERITELEVRDTAVQTAAAPPAATRRTARRRA
jgi:hypothetical protein